MYTTASSTTSASAMLKLNSASSNSGGNGTTIIASSNSSNSGVPRPRPSWPPFTAMEFVCAMRQRLRSSGGIGNSSTGGGVGKRSPGRWARNWKT